MICKETELSIDIVSEEVCHHTGNINSETSKIDGHIDYYICADCGKIVKKYIINNKECWI